MKTKPKKSFIELRKFISLLFPCVLAILTTEFVAVLLFSHAPELKKNSFIAGWWILQAIGGAIFGKISDKHYRRKALIFCQIFGIISGIILLKLKLNLVFLGIIALTFNPLPVARAALLDNFPNHPSLRIIGITYFLRFAPWLFSNVFGSAEYRSGVIFVFICLVVSFLTTLLFFKGSYDKHLNRRKKGPEKWCTPYVLLIMFAFIFAEQAFYIDWDQIEHISAIRETFPLVTFGTLVGVLIATIYPKVPHISVISICYMIGTATAASIVFQYIITGDKTFNTLTISMSIFSIVGGLYLTLFADLLISVLGKKRRAFGSALAEIGEAIASSFAAISSFLIVFNPIKMGIAFLLLFLISSVLQKWSESIHPKKAK